MKRFLSVFLTVCVLFGLLGAGVSAVSGTPAAAKVTTGTANLNVRAGASTSAAVTAKLKNGTWVTLLQKSGNWYRVRYGENKTGYCHADYLAVRDGSFLTTVSAGGSNLNVRKGAGTRYDVKAKLPDGAVVAVLSQSGGWSRILYDGSTPGYVLSAYLAANQTRAIRYSVPYYSQVDTRWKNTAIGTSGGTIGTIGCTTTCLAMLESFRTGTAVTPKAMASSLRYMPGGALYWPADYNTALAGDDPLQQILDVLQSGKPVIYGCKKPGGTQHWCVVTGWNGKSKTASAFTINDPASAARTTLADFAAVYATPYKLAWYK